MRAVLRAAALAVAAVALLGAPARAETLADTLADAYRNSALLEQNRALLRAADEDVAQAVAALRPVVQFVASSGYAKTGNFEGLSSSIELSASMTLYDFGRNKLAADAARESVLATREALLGLEQQVLLGAVQAYANLVSAGEFVRLREANVRLITQELRAANDRFDVGEVTRTDVSIAEARLAAARANLAVAQGDLQIAVERFRAAVGRDPGPLTSPGRAPRTAASVDEARTVAVRTHPTIRRAQYEVSASEISAERARRLTRGTLSANAAYGLDDDGQDSASLGLRFTQPIYQGGGLASAYRQALAGRDAARAALLDARLAVERDVGTAWAQLAVAQASLAASEEQIRAASVAFEGVQEEARLGARTTLDVLNAEQELLDARTARVDAASQQLIAVYSLLSAMGLLTVEHLGLGVPVYDPAAYYDAVKNAPAASVQGERLDRILRTLGEP